MWLHRLSRNGYLEKTIATRFVEHKGGMVKRGYKFEFTLSEKGENYLIQGRKHLLYEEGAQVSRGLQPKAR